MRCSGPTTTSTPSICRTLMDKSSLCKLFFVFLVFFSFNTSRRDRRGTKSCGKKGDETTLATTRAKCVEDETGLALAKHTTDGVGVALVKVTSSGNDIIEQTAYGPPVSRKTTIKSGDELEVAATTARTGVEVGLKSRCACEGLLQHPVGIAAHFQAGLHNGCRREEGVEIGRITPKSQELRVRNGPQ